MDITPSGFIPSGHSPFRQFSWGHSSLEERSPEDPFYPKKSSDVANIFTIPFWHRIPFTISIIRSTKAVEQKACKATMARSSTDKARKYGAYSCPNVKYPTQSYCHMNNTHGYKTFRSIHQNICWNSTQATGSKSSSFDFYNVGRTIWRKRTRPDPLDRPNHTYTTHNFTRECIPFRTNAHKNATFVRTTIDCNRGRYVKKCPSKTSFKKTFKRNQTVLFSNLTVINVIPDLGFLLITEPKPNLKHWHSLSPPATYHRSLI